MRQSPQSLCPLGPHRYLVATMPPKARKTNPPTLANTNRTVARKASLRQVQPEDRPFAVDDVQGGAQGTGPSRGNRNHHGISSSQVTDDQSRADIQARIVRVAELEDQNRRLLE